MLRIWVDHYGDPVRSVRAAYKKLAKIVDREGVTKELRKKEFYEKPSVRRRRKALKSRHAMEKRLREETEMKSRKTQRDSHSREREN